MRARRCAPSSTDRVLKYMRDFGSITPAEAMYHLGVGNLARRIADIERRGHEVERSWATARNRYGEQVRFRRYRLAQAKHRRSGEEGSEWSGFPGPTYRG